MSGSLSPKRVVASVLLLAQAVLPGCAADRASEGAANPAAADAALAAQGFTRPELMEDPVPFAYSWEAYDARVEGLFQARCLITQEGTVRSCRVLKSLPHMDEALLLSLYRRRFKPVMHKGRPIQVDYGFNVRVESRTFGAGRQFDFFKVADYRASLEKWCAREDSPCAPERIDL